MSNKAPKPPRPKKQRQKAGKKRAGISPLGILLGLATLVGGVAALLTFLPRVTPTISDPADPENPFSSSITITNTGYIPLNSVAILIKLGTWCAMGSCPEKTQFPNPHRFEGLEDYENFQRHEWSKHSLGIDDRFTVALNDLFDQAPNGGTEYADFDIVVQYEIPIIHWKRQKIFPFYTRTQGNGKLYWYWGRRANLGHHRVWGALLPLTSPLQPPTRSN